MVAAQLRLLALNAAHVPAQKRPFYVLSVMQRRQARNSGNRYEDVGWWDPNQGEGRAQQLTDQRGAGCSVPHVHVQASMCMPGALHGGPTAAPAHSTHRAAR